MIDTIVGVLADAAATRPDAAAITDGTTALTAATLRERARRGAGALVAAGVPAGARVALWAPNSVDWAVANLAVLSAGCTVVPISTRATETELRDACTRARIAAVLTVGEFLGRRYAMEAGKLPDRPPVFVLDGASWRDACADAADADIEEAAARAAAVTPDSISHVQFTAGTTGRAKGVMLRHGAMVGTTRSWVSVVGLGPGDVYPVVSPCSHIAGHKTGLLACLVAGATAMPIPVFSADSLANLVDTVRITFLQGAPTMFHDLVRVASERGRPFSSVRAAVTGAASIPPSLIRELRDVAGIPVVLCAYGLTETTGVVAMTTRADPFDAGASTVGWPVPGVEIRLVDPDAPDVEVEHGEVLVRGPSVMAGYLDDPVATAAVMHRDWLRTGDVGEFDPDGRLRIVDRIKDMIVVGGFNVYPAEVEHVLVLHPSVARAAVVGDPDPRLGEVPVAYVVGHAAVTPEELVRHCRALLVGYKVPRHVRLVDSLPTNAAGKVLKAELRGRGDQR